MDIIVSNEETPLTKQDCIEYVSGSPAFRQRADRGGERLGQAWMNCLDEKDYSKLTGSLYDPFYATDWPSVIRALRFLLDN